MTFDINPQRRFAGNERLYGSTHFTHLMNAHAIVIGIGGVGSWAAEALARTGVGSLTLIDLDVVSESNINRQLIADTSTLGDSKIQVMAKRIQTINPDCRVSLIDDFITSNNVADHLPSKSIAQSLISQNQPLVVLDCVDDIHAKTAIALHCRFNKLKLVIAGGAGGKTDPSQLCVGDLKETYQDPLLAKLRKNLRTQGINSDLKQRFNLKCVYSREPPRSTKHQHRLACGGYGSAMVVTCTMAMLMVAQSISHLKPSKKEHP